MSHPRAPQPAKLVIGLFLRNKLLLQDVTPHLLSAYGGIDMVSTWQEFSYTDYYTAEMGTPLHRRMLTFRNLIPQKLLPEIKLKTNEIEKAYTIDGRRQVNIDPGYLLLERFVLATGKNYSHRIYMDKGIYADLTLIFQKGGYQPLPWTYPDYGSPLMGEFLMQVRQRYAADLKRSKKESSDDA